MAAYYEKKVYEDANVEVWTKVQLPQGIKSPYDRVMEEKDDLFRKMLKLYSFMQSSEFKNLSESMRSLLKGQYTVMKRYREILIHRLIIWENQ